MKVKKPFFHIFACRLALPLLLGLVFPLGGAEITVPRMEIATMGSIGKAAPTLASVAAVDIALDGGYKYQAYLGFSFTSKNLEKALAYGNFTFAPVPGIIAPPPPETELSGEELAGAYADLAAAYAALADRMNNQAVLSFRIARAMARDLFTLPLDLSYFIGIADYFCSGDDFVNYFGAAPMGTEFRGFFYFPQGVGGDISRQYNGIHGVRGTGLSFALTPWDQVVPLVYLYQDLSFIDPRTGIAESGRYSGDLRVLINLDRVKLEGFAGGTVGLDKPGVLRGGLLAFFSSGRGANFLLQCGVPGWNTQNSLSIDNVFFLMEPRVDFDLLRLAVTFFYHPAQYLQIETPTEQGRADVNLKVSAGDIARATPEGGVETTLGLKVDGMEELSVRLSPFISFVSSGLRWDAKVRFDLLGSKEPASLFDVFIGIRTAY
jgi:hypothetical protein